LICNLCPRKCNIDRSISVGACNVDWIMKVGSIVIHRGEEPPLVTGSGSGAVFFSGCPLRCSYCQNNQISHQSYGRPISIQGLADHLILLEEKGCSNINLVSASHYTPQVIKSIKQAVKHGLSIPVMLNSGGYESLETLRLLNDHVQIYLLDLKYGDNVTGKTLSSVPNYWDVAKRAISLAWEMAGPLETDSSGRAVKGLIIRHLVLPGMLSNPFSVLEFLAGISTDIPVSIMSQYSPMYYKGDISLMKRPVEKDEYTVVLKRAMDLGFSTIYTQNIDSTETYLPDFQKDSPFGDYQRFF